MTKYNQLRQRASLPQVMGFSKLNYYVLLLLRLHGEAQAFVGGEKVMEKFLLEYNSCKVVVFAGFIEIKLRLFAMGEVHVKSNLRISWPC